MALEPNGMRGDCRMLLFSDILLGDPRIEGRTARGPDRRGELAPDLLSGELVGVTCHVLTGGGVSHELPEADRRRPQPPLGGVPIMN